MTFAGTSRASSVESRRSEPPARDAAAGAAVPSKAVEHSGGRRSGRALRLRLGSFGAIWIATAVLFAISPLLAHGSLSHSALMGMLPFAAVLAIAAAGQTLVIQQGGLDLSVPGVISLSAIFVAQYSGGSNGKLGVALLIVAGICVAVGLINGLAITRFGITPLIATLGVNALLTGAVLQYTGGSVTASAPSRLVSIASGKAILGIPNTVLIAALIVLLITAVIRRTVSGRRFVATGTSPRAAYAAGIGVYRQRTLTYVAAALLYGVAGVLISGFLRSPNLEPGASYLLPTIAAVVLGGTSLAGGRGSVLATAIGALFLTQLNQVVLGMGAASSVQLLIEGAIIAVGMGLRNVPWRRLLAARGRSPTPI